LTKISCDSEIFDMLLRGDTKGAREAVNGNDQAWMQALISDSQFTLSFEAFARKGKSFIQHDKIDLRALVNFRKGLVTPFKVSDFENVKWEVKAAKSSAAKTVKPAAAAADGVSE